MASEKVIKCKTKYCRNTVENISGVYEPDGWLCEKCWYEKCKEER